MIFLFMSFLAAPTIISLLEDDCDTSMAYSLNEEEMQKEMKEIKAAPSRSCIYIPCTSKKTCYNNI